MLLRGVPPVARRLQRARVFGRFAVYRVLNRLVGVTVENGIYCTLRFLNSLL